MCSIVDANVAHEVFGTNRPSAGKEFFKWITKGKGRLVAGGKLLAELNKTSARDWAKQAINAGLIRSFKADDVDPRAEELRLQGNCKSNDPHVLALAQVSGARLLYSNDGDLQHDFKNRLIVNSPRGKVYSTLENKEFVSAHKRLLQNRNLCGASQ